MTLAAIGLLAPETNDDSDPLLHHEDRKWPTLNVP